MFIFLWFIEEFVSLIRLINTLISLCFVIVDKMKNIDNVSIIFTLHNANLNFFHRAIVALSSPS